MLLADASSDVADPRRQQDLGSLRRCGWQAASCVCVVASQHKATTCGQLVASGMQRRGCAPLAKACFHATLQ